MKLSVKEKFATDDAVRSRHRERAGDGLRKRREAEKHSKRRQEGSGNLSEQELRTLIQQHSPMGNNLEILCQVLGSGKAVYRFFAPEATWPEYAQGPFIFTDANKTLIPRLVQAFAAGNLIAGDCLIHISSHDNNFVWAFKLAEAGAVDVALAVARENRHGSQATATAYWILANMCTDNERTRNHILERGVLDVLKAQTFDPVVLLDMCCLFKTLYDHVPVPPIESIANGVWPKMAQIFCTTDVEPIRNVLLLAMINMSRCSNQYVEWLVAQEAIMQRIVTLAPTIEVLYLCATLTRCDSAHMAMAPYDVVGVFVAGLLAINPAMRIEGGLGLCNLAHTPLYLERLCEPRVLDVVFMQFRNTDIWRVLKELYWFLTQLIIIAPSQTEDIREAILYRLMANGVIVQLLQLFRSEADPNLLHDALMALGIIFTWQGPAALQEFEDHEGVAKLEALEFNPSCSAQVQALATRLVRSFFSSMDDVE